MKKIETPTQISEFLNKAEHIFQGIRQAAANREALITSLPEVVVMTFGEIKQKHNKMRPYLADNTEVVVYQGDVSIQGTLDYAWLIKHAHTNRVIIEGNLRVGGDIMDGNYSDENEIYLGVTGDVFCDFLHTQDGYIVIERNLSTLYGIRGIGNGGSLEVYVNTFTPYLFNEDDHYMPDDSKEPYILIGYEYIETKHNDDWQRTDDHGLLLKECFLEKDDEAKKHILVDKVIDAIRNGENPFFTINETSIQNLGLL